MTPRAPRLALALGLMLAGIAPAASGDPASPAPPSVRLSLDNDHFNFWQSPGWRPDFGYTHGTELALRIPRASGSPVRLVPAWASGANRHGGDAALEFRLRQNIYSPWVIPPDRPYAGWLEAAAGISYADDRSYREVLAHVGVTGPPSLAGSVQRSLHRRIDGITPPDWNDQLPFEPGFGLEAGLVARAADHGGPQAWSVQAGVSGRARLATYAVDLRLGIPMVAGWNPPGLWPGARARRPGAALFVRFHPRLDLIARDEFLDGPLFHDRPGPGARAWVGESEVAVGCGWNRLELEWAVMRRSREYEAQPKPHTYASLSATWTP